MGGWAVRGVLSGSAVGTYTELTLPALSLGGTDAANYTLTQPGKVSGSFTIEPKTVTPTVVVAAGSYVYNGKAHTPAVTVKDGSTVKAPTEAQLESYKTQEELDAEVPEETPTDGE